MVARGNSSGILAIHLLYTVMSDAVQIGGNDMLIFKYFMLFLVCSILVVIAIPFFLICLLLVPLLLIAALIV
jgi:hypothetical protein